MNACVLYAKGGAWEPVLQGAVKDGGSEMLGALAARAGRCARHDRAGVRVVEGRLQGLDAAAPERLQGWLLPGLPTTHLRSE